MIQLWEANQLLQDGALVALNPDDVLCLIKEGHVPRGEGGEIMLLLSDEQSKVYPHITHQAGAFG